MLYRRFFFLLGFALSLLITGCKSSVYSEIGIPAVNNYKTVERTPVPRPNTDRIIFRMAENQAAFHPATVGDHKFAELVEERTSGRIKINVYYEAKLGDEKSVIEQVQFGGIDFARVNSAPLTDIDPALNVLSLPYLFRDSEHMWKVLNGPVGEELLQTLLPQNLVGFAYYDSGARSFYTKKPVRTVSDMKGMKIRIQQSKLYADLVYALGAVPVPLVFGNVYSSLQTNEVEGAENNWTSYLSTKHYEVAKYFTVDMHTRSPEIVIANKDAMDRLPKEDREIIRQAAVDSVEFQREAWVRAEKEAEEEVKNLGTVVIEPVEAERREFENAVAPIYNIYGKDYSGIIDRIKNTK